MGASEGSVAALCGIRLKHVGQFTALLEQLAHP